MEEVVRGQDIAVLRVDGTGTVRGANAAAATLFGACVGRPCRFAVAATRRSGEPVCTAACAAAVTSGSVTRDVLGAVVRGKVGRVTCSRVGDETIVVVQRSERDARAFPDRLTRRERDVLGHVADGLTNHEIADVLGLRPATVRTHVEHALHKLGATSRAEAVVAARDLGELP